MLNIGEIYIKDNNFPNPYKQLLSLVLLLNDGILNIPGKKYIINGYNIDIVKLINVSLIKGI